MLLFASPAFDQVIQPGFHDLPLSPGQRKRLEFTVSNSQDITLTCRLTIQDMIPNLEGYPQAMDSHPRGASSWATMSADSLILAPRTTQTVTVDITVPRDAAGGYYALIQAMFRAADRSLDELTLADRADGRYAFFPPTLFRSILLTEVRTRHNTAVVVSDSLHIGSGRTSQDPLALAADPRAGRWSVDLIARNDGNTHSRVAGSASIWRANGTLVGQAPFEAGRGYLLPEVRRVFKATGSDPLPDGMYLARLNLSIERQGRTQQVASFYVSDGVATPGEPDSAMVALLHALMPSFSFRDQFQETAVRPGRDASLMISLNNSLDTAQDLRPVPMLWRIDSEGNNELAAGAELGVDGPDSWFTDVPEIITLPPRRSATSRLRVRPPADLPPGEYFLGVLFESPDGHQTPAAARLSRSQLVCLVNGRDLNFAAELDTFLIKLRDRALDLECRLTNNGQLRAACQPSVRISRRDEAGGYVQVGEEVFFPVGETSFVLPGENRVYRQQVAGLTPGRYQVNLRVQFWGEGRDPIRRTEYLEIR